MPSVSGPQHRAMEAAAHGRSNLGIPASVGKDFSEADQGKSFKDHDEEPPMIADNPLLAKIDELEDALEVLTYRVGQREASRSDAQSRDPDGKFGSGSGGNSSGKNTSKDLPKGPSEMSSSNRNMVQSLAKEGKWDDLRYLSSETGSTGEYAHELLGHFNQSRPNRDKPVRR